jgi:hypothetical protein
MAVDKGIDVRDARAGGLVMQRIRWVIIATLIAVLVCVALGIVLTHGYFWSFREMAFRRLLRSLPEPSGWLPDTDLLSADAYSPYGYRYYDVDGRHVEIVDFFKVEFPRVGWDLLTEKESAPDAQQTDDIPTVSLLFSYEGQYCLAVRVATPTDSTGIQHKSKVVVHMTITEEPDCGF